MCTYNRVQLSFSDDKSWMSWELLDSINCVVDRLIGDEFAPVGVQVPESRPRLACLRAFHSSFLPLLPRHEHEKTILFSLPVATKHVDEWEPLESFVSFFFVANRHRQQSSGAAEDIAADLRVGNVDAADRNVSLMMVSTPMRLDVFGEVYNADQVPDFSIP
jgi:hypothetical protein